MRKVSPCPKRVVGLGMVGAVSVDHTVDSFDEDCVVSVKLLILCHVIVDSFLWKEMLLLNFPVMSW